MDASGADKLILLVQPIPVLYDKSATGYKVKNALEKGDIWQIGVDIAVNSERTTDLRCRFSFLVSRWRCDRSVRFLVSRFSFLVSRSQCDRTPGPDNRVDTRRVKAGSLFFYLPVISFLPYCYCLEYPLEMVIEKMPK